MNDILSNLSENEILFCGKFISNYFLEHYNDYFGNYSINLMELENILEKLGISYEKIEN